MALTSAQQALLLFKKWLGLGQTTSSREFFNETAYPGRVAVYTNQIWTQADQIPNAAPVLSSGQTSGVVQYWQNSPLGAVPGTTNAFTSSLLINAIPFNYGDGTSYNYSVRDSIGGTIAFGQGDWIVDTDAGLLTFYSTVPANMPPTISFYKYVGTKGFTSSSVALTGSLFGTASLAISSSVANTASFIEYTNIANKPTLISSSAQINTGSFSGSFIGTLIGTGSWAISSSFTVTASFATTASYVPPSFIDNLVTVGLIGSDTNYNSIKTAVDSITDASVVNTYTVRVYPGVYIEDTITLKPYIAIKGDSSISTIVSASNPNNSIFVMSDQSMVIDMQIQGSTGTNASAVMYSSPTTPQTNAIAYVENVRFGTNYTNAKVMGSGSSGNCILQCSNVKYGGFTSGSKSFDVGFYVTSGSDGGIGRMQLRNVTSTNGGVAGTDNDQIFALADAPGCTFIVNGCLLTRSTGVARGTGFKVYNGGQLRLTAVNFQRWIRGIWAPQIGSAPNIDAIALNFENCTTDVQIDHSGSLGKVSGTDNFLKTIINKDAPLYEVNQDPRRITVAKKGGDFTSISASVAYITDSAENNRYVIEVGPGQFTEKQIDMRGKPYIAIRGSDIQTTVIIPSGSGTFDQLIIGPTNEVSFLTLKGNNVAAYSALSMPDVGLVTSTDFAMAHKISIYDYDYGIKVCADTANSTFYGEYIDINGAFSYGLFVSSSNNFSALTNVENYYLFPSNSSGIGNYIVGPSSSVSLYTGLFKGDSTAGSTTIKIEQGAELEAAGLDIQDWDYGVRVPAASPAPEFRIVGSMIHNSTTYDFDVLNTSTKGRFQGVASHGQVNNLSPEFFWNFLDDTDGENDITRKLSVTFADGTHTDATTLIFKGSPMGVMEGGNITTGSNFDITVASGFGYVQDAIDVAIYKRIDWVNGNLTLTANSNNYIYLTSAEVLTAAGSLPNNETNIILGRVVTNNTTIELIDQAPYNGEHMSNKLSTFNREALGPVYAAGSTVTEDATPFKLDVTAGTYFFSENKFTPVGTSSINLTQYYPSASTWARYTSSVVPNNLYASASTLAPLSASAYTKHTVYGVGEGIDEKYFLVINSNQYSTLVAAENANLPSIPSYFNDGVVALAAVYVQSGSANITQIQDIRPTIGFRAAGVNASSVHGNLLGLSADDHTQYLLVNGARAMAGDLSLNGNNITNVGTMFGTASWAENAINAVTASAATSITFIPPTASFATTSSAATSITFIPATASFATTAISASYFSGSISFPNGLIVTGGLVVTSISASSGIIGNLIGTSSWASNAVAAQNGFPFTGSAIISGSTRITGSLSILSGSISSSGPQSSLYFDNTFSTLSIANSSGAWRYSAISAYHLFRVNDASTLLIDVGSTSPAVTNAYSLGSTGNRFLTLFSNNINTTGSIIHTGSLNILSGSINIINGGVTSSLFGTASVALSSSVAVSASYAPTILPSGLVSSSTQINTGSFTGSFVGEFIGTSSWAQNVISASFATTSSFAVSASWAPGGGGSNDWNNLINIPSGLVSSSTQINTGSFTGSFVGVFTGSLFGTSSVAASASFATTAATASSFTGYINFPNGLDVTGSLFVTGSGLIVSGTTNLVGNVTASRLLAPSITGSLFGTSSWAVSSSYIIPTGLPLGTVSSSVQINTGSFTGSFTGEFIGTSSWASNVISASFATTASAANSITFTPETASFATSASYAPITLPDGLVSSSTQINTGSFSGSFIGTLIGTSSWATNAVTASYFTGSVTFPSGLIVTGSILATTVSASLFLGPLAGTASFATSASFAPPTFPFTGSAIVSGSMRITGSLNILSGSINITNGGVTSSLFGTASNAISSSYALSSSYAPTILPDGLVSSSTQIDYNSIQNQPTTIPTASYVLNAVSASFSTTSSFAISASWAPGGAGSNDWNDLINVPSGLVSSSTQINTGSFTGSFIGEFIGTSSWASNVISASFATTSSFATSASYAPFTLPDGIVSSSSQINTGSFTGSFVGIFTGSVFGTSSVATSSSFATTASYAPDTTFPYVGAAVITGSLTVTGSTGINVTGPVTITGALQAQTKSFKIDHQILLGKKLIYGVLEGPEHGVYVRGRLTRNTVIYLPEEWKWLVDPTSITVQLTPIGTQQVLYVQNIENNTVIINSNTPIDCFYYVQATRKDVAPLTTVE